MCHGQVKCVERAQRKIKRTEPLSGLPVITLQDGLRMEIVARTVLAKKLLDPMGITRLKFFHLHFLGQG